MILSSARRSLSELYSLSRPMISVAFSQAAIESSVSREYTNTIPCYILVEASDVFQELDCN